MAVDANWDSELSALFDAISYEMSNARAAGLSEPEKLRESLKRVREKLSQADSLAIAANAERQKGETG